jgi:hypothetical protein
MAKPTKAQRRERRIKKAADRSKRRSDNARPKPWVVPKMKLFSLPSFMPEGLSAIQRIEIVRSIGSDAQKTFEEGYPRIGKWFEEYDAIYLLSYCAMYFMAHPEGIDYEVTGELTFYHHYLEILQAFALTKERTVTVRPLFQKAQELKGQMEYIGKAMSLRMLNLPEGIETDAEIHAFHLRTEMMSQTAAIRNWAYHHQVKRVCQALANAIAEKFKAAYGLDPADFMNLLFALVDEREDLLNQHIDRVRTFAKLNNYKEIIGAFNLAFPENQAIEGEDVEKTWSHVGKKKDNLLAMLFAHADLKIEDVYSFTLEHANSMLKTPVDEKKLALVFDRLSYKFGELKDFPVEHFVLGNPVLNRPFILTKESSYFSAVWGVMPHIALDILEALMWEFEELKTAYVDVKARYLENEIERLFRSGFPNARIFTGSLWEDAASGRVYENDLLLVLENFAFVVEAKSGTVTDPAKRGAPKRLFDTLRQLIEEPSIQAHRFIKYLKDNPREHTLKTKRGHVNVVDSSSIKYYVPLGVTFSQLGMIGSNLKKLIDARVVEKKLEELAPSISFTDLEIVFDLLPLEVQKIHYLVRRREFEAHLRYQGDEMDLLSFYLDHGFNIGDAEYSDDLAINLSMKSKELDPHFVGLSDGKEIPKPVLQMSKWWQDILTGISDRRIEGWVETAFILLNTTKEDQLQFEAKFKELARRVKSGKVTQRHNWVMFSSGPERRRYLITGYPYTGIDRETRNSVIGDIISEENSGKYRGEVVIGVDVDRLDYPYSVLVRRAATDLFDDLTLEQRSALT